MTKRRNNWIVITGSPSSGKTSLLEELAKLGYQTYPETARRLIDDSLAKGISVEQLRSDEKLFQERVAKLKQELESSLRPNKTVFLDRGMQDTLAYLRHYNFAIEQWVMELMEAAHYQMVFLLDQLPVFKEDYARTENQAFAESLNQLLFEAYCDFDMMPIRVPATDQVSDRVEFVIDKIKEGK
jgi:predicted ATPase